MRRFTYDYKGLAYRSTCNQGFIGLDEVWTWLSFGYDAYGNLTDKSSTVTNDLNVTGYGYAASGKPHRLTAVTIAGNVNTLTYDSNGSITKYDALTGDDTDLVYDGQNRVTSISVGTLPTARDEFWYDPDGQRFLGRETWQSSGTKTALTVYLGAFEEVIPASGSSYNLVQRTDLTATVRHLRTRTTGGVIATRFEYLHRDHLGSVDAVTDSAGLLLNNKTSYDAFAGRREANWASDITSASLTTLVSNEDERFARGYTDHEQLNRTGFIHINGRIYDPRIGRLVSADPIVQSPTHSQSYNRYSYTFNSPLSYVDPSGFGTLDEPSIPVPPGAPLPGWVWWQGNPGTGYYALEHRRPATMDKEPRSPSQPSPVPGDSSPMPGGPEPRNDFALADLDSMGDQELLDWILGHANELGIWFGPNFKVLRATGERAAKQCGRDGCKLVPCAISGCSDRVTEVFSNSHPLDSEVRVYAAGLEAGTINYDIGDEVVTEHYSRVEMAIFVVAHEAAHTRGIDMRRSEQDPSGQHPLANRAGREAVDRFRKLYPSSP